MNACFRYGVELVCYVEAFPRPTITWVHRGIQLSTNQKYIVDNGFATIDAFIETSVRIRSLDRRTLGTYSCRATNKLGETQKEMNVSEAYTPNCAIGLCSDADPLHAGGVGHASGSILAAALAASFVVYLSACRLRPNL